MSGEKGGACSPPIPMLHSLRVSSVPWGKTRRYHNTYEPRLADTKSKSAYSPAQCPGSFQSWLLGPSARKCHFSLRHLTPYHSFQIPHLFSTLKSAPGTTFKKKKKKKKPPQLFLFKPNLRIQYYVPWGYRSHAHSPGTF